MKRRLMAMMTAALVASLGGTQTLASAGPRDVLAGVWRQVEDFDQIPSNRKVERLCGQRYRPDLLRELDDEALQVVDQFVQILDHDSVYLAPDYIYMSPEFKTFGISGRQQMKEIRQANFGYGRVRKFLAKRKGVYFYIYYASSSQSRAMRMRVVQPKQDPEFYVKCP